MKVVRFLALYTGRLYVPSDNPGTYFCYKLIRPQDNNVPMGNRTSDLPAGSAPPQPTAPLRLCSVIGGFVVVVVIWAPIAFCQDTHKVELTA
jgi:hypothetical protein